MFKFSKPTCFGDTQHGEVFWLFEFLLFDIVSDFDTCLTTVKIRISYLYIKGGFF